MKRNWNYTTRLVFLINSDFHFVTLVSPIQNSYWPQVFPLPMLRLGDASSGTLYRARSNVKVQGRGVERFSSACLTADSWPAQRCSWWGSSNSYKQCPKCKTSLTGTTLRFDISAFLVRSPDLSHSLVQRNPQNTNTQNACNKTQNAFHEYTIWYFVFCLPYN